MTFMMTKVTFVNFFIKTYSILSIRYMYKISCKMDKLFLKYSMFFHRGSTSLDLLIYYLFIIVCCNIFILETITDPLILLIIISSIPIFLSCFINLSLSISPFHYTFFSFLFQCTIIICLITNNRTLLN